MQPAAARAVSKQRGGRHTAAQDLGQICCCGHECSATFQPTVCCTGMQRCRTQALYVLVRYACAVWLCRTM